MAMREQTSEIHSGVKCIFSTYLYHAVCSSHNTLFVLPAYLLLLSSSSSSSSSSTIIIVVHVHYHCIMASLVSLISNDISNVCIVINYLCIQAWFSLVYKTKEATQSLLNCLSTMSVMGNWRFFFNFPAPTVANFSG